MARQAKRGRPAKHYTTSWGETVPGLARGNDGRWRVIATGQRYTEPDERRAVARFRQQAAPPTVDVPHTFRPAVSQPHKPPFRLVDETPPAVKAALQRHRETNPATPPWPARSDMSLVIGEAVVESPAFWGWLRELMIAQPAYCAQMLGIPELANLQHLPIPKAAITIDQLIQAYETHNPSTPATKRRVVAAARRLQAHAKAKTLADLSQESLLAWRQSIEADPKLKSAGTRAGMYGQVKTLLSFGLKVGLDQTQIRSALDRCAVLWTAEPLPPVNPRPISRDDFHRLLKAGGDMWRPWLLLSLNLCCTAEDLCQARWEHFDLDADTYVAIRHKTRRDRIPRAATLWAETVEAVRRLPRKSPYVFTSPHGTHYNKSSRVNLFATLRDRSGLAKSVTWATIRDGAYTAASRGTADERWARVLAGHRTAGLQDHYVLRNPEAVRPACDAVYAAYGPF